MARIRLVIARNTITLLYNNVVYLAGIETKRKTRERERACSCYFRVGVDFICQMQRKRKREKRTPVVNTDASNGLRPGTSSVRCEMLLGTESRFGVPFWFRIYVASCTSRLFYVERFIIMLSLPLTLERCLYRTSARIHSGYDRPSFVFTHDDTHRSCFLVCDLR